MIITKSIDRISNQMLFLLLSFGVDQLENEAAHISLTDFRDPRKLDFLSNDDPELNDDNVKKQ